MRESLSVAPRRPPPRSGTVRAIDRKQFDEWFQIHAEVETRQLDLSLLLSCCEASDGVGQVYNVAADMGSLRMTKPNACSQC